MSLSQLGSAPTFQFHAQGTIGEFRTPAGRVSYLMTKARLGAEATDPERRLTQHLVPVREVIPSEELDFNQLLQRDLDDHRVAVSLVPYLLKPDWAGPAFFPPIVAIALPFEGQHPAEFPVLSDPVVVNDITPNLSWQQQDAGQHLRVRRLLDTNGQFSPVALGQVWWNSEFCRIVVVDGQHRAMAFLAIDRTVRNTWHETAAAKYKYFYDARIKKELEGRDVNLDDIEVPVTILWFPEKFGPGQEPHKAARKVFVDVNKEARTPSESRLILLSDSELLNILTRAALTQLRNQSAAEFLPLYSVEYDNPDTKSTQSARWSALTNIHIIKEMVERTVFGPPKYINNVETPIGKREPEEEKNAFMRKQLGTDALFNPVIEGDRPFQRNRLGNTDFPDEAVEKLTKSFRDSWGTALLILLSKVLPYAAHAKALSQLKQDWLADDAIATLAWDALFSGVGMFWTLRDSANFWEDEKTLSGGGSKQKPDVVKAWDMIADKQLLFEELRAEELLGSKSKREAANQVYQALNTHACQLGLALTLATLHKRAGTGSNDVVALARGIADGVNTWMLSKTTGDYDRRLALAKRRDLMPKNALNTIANMDTPRAIQFRYFWLEILSSPPAIEKLVGLVDESELRALRDSARAAYIVYVSGEKEKALRTSNPSLSDSDRKKQAMKGARNEVRQALIKWFGFAASDIDAWLEAPGESSVLAAEQEEALESELDELDEEAAEYANGAISDESS
jgi:hypothetical protein